MLNTKATKITKKGNIKRGTKVESAINFFIRGPIFDSFIVRSWWTW
jgi:hypothetical protein